MNIIRMTGGLGNQMFQYALYLNFINRGVDCKFEDWSEYEGKSNARPILLNKAFGITYPVATMPEYVEMTDSYMDLGHRILRKLRGRQSREYPEATFDFDEQILTKNNSYLTGYFQSESYFKDIKSKVYEAFTFTPDVVTESNSLLPGPVFDSSANYVSLHIRRGDYLNITTEFGDICTDEYYINAIKYIIGKVENPFFLIFSNDVPWVKNWCPKIFDSFDERQIQYCIIENSSEETGYLDMCLMSRCKHNIIANSSFSWWGSYLNANPNKIVIAPSKWNNVTNQTDIFSPWMTIL